MGSKVQLPNFYRRNIFFYFWRGLFFFLFFFDTDWCGPFFFFWHWKKGHMRSLSGECSGAWESNTFFFFLALDTYLHCTVCLSSAIGSDDDCRQTARGFESLVFFFFFFFFYFCFIWICCNTKKWFFQTYKKSSGPNQLKWIAFCRGHHWVWRRPMGVQLKKEAKLWAVIGLTTKHADCRLIFM